jgi:hypothetical protein
MVALAGCPGRDPSDGTPSPLGGQGDPSGSGPTPRPSLDGLRSEYGQVVDVQQAGAAADASSAINDVITDEAGDDTALYFPKGEYVLDEPLRIEEFSNLALVGDDAVVRPPQGYGDVMFGLGSDSDATGLYFEGFTFDLTADDTGARPIHGKVADDLLVRNVVVRGRQDVEQDSVRFDVTDSDGRGRVEGLRLPDGADTRYANTGIYVGEDNQGTLSFVNCLVAGFPDNGLYASPSLGPIRVIGGRYLNNGISGVRVSGNSLVRGVTVRCDTDREGMENMRGIRLRSGRRVVVENATIEMKQVTESDGALTMAAWLEEATVRNTTIRTDADDVPGINAKSPADEEDSIPGITLQGIEITGEAADGAAIAVADRSNCRFQGVCIAQDGEDRDGIQLSDSDSSTLRRSTIAVHGRPLVLENATLKRRNVQLRRGARKCL